MFRERPVALLRHPTDTGRAKRNHIQLWKPSATRPPWKVASVEVVDEGFHRVFLGGGRLVQLGLLEVGDGDGFVAVRARAAGAQADGEGVAVGAALLAE